MARLHGISANGVGSFKEIDMYEIQKYRPGDEKTAVALLVIVVLLVGFFSLGYMLGLRNAGKADGDGGDGGAGQIGQHIQSAAATQREITERIDRQQDSAAQISSRIEESATGIENAAAATGRAESLVRESGELIAEGQRIIQAIRSRAEKGKAAD